jgi:UDP-3-O-[3-hydroxymyristoyl] glucosamine N-acyltransferase
VAAKSAVVQDIKEHGDYGGYPAIKASRWRRQLIALKNLAERVKPKS